MDGTDHSKPCQAFGHFLSRFAESLWAACAEAFWSSPGFRSLARQLYPRPAVGLSQEPVLNMNYNKDNFLHSRSQHAHHTLYQPSQAPSIAVCAAAAARLLPCRCPTAPRVRVVLSRPKHRQRNTHRTPPVLCSPQRGLSALVHCCTHLLGEARLELTCLASHHAGGGSNRGARQRVPRRPSAGRREAGGGR